MNITKLKISMGLIFFSVSILAYASGVTIPNQFQAGSKAFASEVNANFDALATAVNDNNTRITANGAATTTNGAAIIANEAAVTANGVAISANTNAITAVQQPLSVFANGQKIGSIINIREYNFTIDDSSYITIEGYIFGVDINGILVIRQPVYLTADCTGPSYVFKRISEKYTNGEVFREPFTGDILQIPANVAGINPFVPGSVIDPNQGGMCIIVAGANANTYYPVQPNDPAVTGVQASYTPPFSVGFQ